MVICYRSHRKPIQAVREVTFHTLVLEKRTREQGSEPKGCLGRMHSGRREQKVSRKAHAWGIKGIAKRAV